MDRHGQKISKRDWVRVEEPFNAKNVSSQRTFQLPADAFFRVKDLSENDTPIVEQGGADWLLDSSKLKRLRGYVDVLTLTPFNGRWVRVDIEKFDSSGKPLGQIFTEKGKVESVTDTYISISNDLPATSGHASVSHPIISIRDIELLAQPDSTIEDWKF